MKYEVTYQNVTTVSVFVEADNHEEAMDKAEDIAELPGLCYHCSSDRDDGNWELWGAFSEDGGEFLA